MTWVVRRGVEPAQSSIGNNAPAEVNRLRGQVQDLEKQLKGLSDELKTMQARFKETLESKKTGKTAEGAKK